MTKQINSKIPAATLAQRIASMSDAQLMDAARELTAGAYDILATRVLEELERRTCGGPSFEAFVAEIYA